MATSKTSSTGSRDVVVGVFEDRSRAQQCVDELRRAGFAENQIGVAARDDAANTSAAGSNDDSGANMATGAATGAAAGAGVGALWALGIAAGVLPAIGPVIAGGIFASLLASAAGGAAAGTLVGALVGLGVPEDEANYYENEFKSGRTVVTVRADGRQAEAQAIINRFGAYDMHNAGSRTTGTAHTAHAATGHTASTAHAAPAATHARSEAGSTVQLHEEQLHARKENVQTGEVRLRKEVTTETQTMQVPVTKEEVVIERRPASGAASSTNAGDIRAGEEIRIPVKEEQVRIEKDVVLKEEVSVGKRKVQETETVQGTVRKEDVRVEETGNVDVHDKTRTPRNP